MIDEKTQFAISQYLDGALEPQEAAELEMRLRTDGEARKVLEEFRRLNDLVNVAMPLPEMDWEKLTHRISAAVDREAADRDVMEAVPMPLVAEAARVWWASPRVWAMAAMLLLCATVALVVWLAGRPGQSQMTASRTPVVLPERRPVVVALVEVFKVDQSAGSVVVDVKVSEATSSYSVVGNGYPELTASEPASVTISALPAGRDTDADHVVQ